MSRVEIKELTDSNFNDFLSLLALRGEAPYNYMYWKYLENPINNAPSGFIAYLDNEPAGCIGVIKRHIINNKQETQIATWFADWFVIESARGNNIGRSLIEKVRDISQFAFGIPGTEAAQALARKAGYKVNFGRADYTYYTNGFRYGFNRYKDNLLKRLLRGIRYWRYQKYKWLNNAKKYTYKPISTESIKNLNFDNNHTFCLDSEFLDWLIKMPSLPNGDKQYWTLSNNSEFILGFNELDQKGFLKASIIYHNLQVDRDSLVKIIYKSIPKKNIYYFIYYDELKHGENPLKNIINRRIMPFAQTTDTNVLTSAIDRESAWFAQQIFY